MHGLGDAWRLWLTGERVDFAVYGVKAVWWARGGKSLEFLAALSIIADVLGPERLRRFGTSLHGALSYRGIWNLVVGSFRWFVAFIQGLFYAAIKDRVRAQQLAEEEWEYPAAALLNLTIGLAVGVATWRSLRSEAESTDFLGTLFLSLMAGGLVMTTVAPFVTVGALLLLSVIGVLCDVLVVKPAAWLLEREGVERRIKIVAAVLLVVGFSFDLLFTP